MLQEAGFVGMWVGNEKKTRLSGGHAQTRTHRGARDYAKDEEQERAVISDLKKYIKIK